MKNYAEKNHKKYKTVNIGDMVLLRNHQRLKNDPIFDPKPMTVIDKKGSMITAMNNAQWKVTRDISQFK